MNNFSTKKINNTKTVILVNVGSYKVRTMLCRFSFSNVKILAYWEKRQSRLDIINNEINNLSGLCSTIKDSILKVELEYWEKVDEVIVNPFFSNIFYYSKNILYKNKDNTKTIDNKDIFKIINYIEENSLQSSFLDIYNKYWLEKQDLKLILANISNINIDWENTDFLLWKKAENIKIKSLNAFIAKSNYDIINEIFSFLWKKIIKIIPEEYSITKIWNKGLDEVFIDIWNSITGLSIKSKDGSLLWALKLEIGIDDLVKDILKNNKNITRVEIIKKISRDDLFKEEKQKFLNFFFDILVEGLKEILAWNICPSNFILVGGWANNNFIKEFLLTKNLWDYWIKILNNKINFLSASIDEIKKISNVENVLNFSNINIIASAVAYMKIYSSKNWIIGKALEKSIEKF